MTVKSSARLERGEEGLLHEILGVGLIAKLSERVMIKIVAVLIDPISRIGKWRWSETRDHCKSRRTHAGCQRPERNYFL